MAVLLISVASLVVLGIVAYYISNLISNNRKSELEVNLQPVFSVHCHVRSDPIVGFSSGKNFYSTLPARFTIYKDFVMLKSTTERSYQRNHVLFVQRPGRFHQRLFIKLGQLDDAIEIVGKTARIIPALKTAGYQVQIGS
jgi:hypothetical protein